MNCPDCEEKLIYDGGIWVCESCGEKFRNCSGELVAFDEQMMPVDQFFKTMAQE